MKAFLVFPHQLFLENLSLNKDLKFYLIEDALYFKQYNFHKHKLILHRASMMHYHALLLEQGFDCTYISIQDVLDLTDFFKILIKHHIKEINFRDVTDDWLLQNLVKLSNQNSLEYKEISTPMFLSEKKYIFDFFEGKKKYLMADFYTAQRKRFDILMDGKKPLGGKWSFDSENRKKLPKNIKLPQPYTPPNNEYIDEAKQFVTKNFADNYGEVGTFNFAINHSEALKCLEDFIETRFTNFGVYEDAIDEKDNYLFHSVLTPYLNTGLLTPIEVLEKVLENTSNIPLNSLEGFIRQIIGWREYMRAIYLLQGRRDRTKNFWKHKRKIPKQFWVGTTTIEPVDNTIKKVLTTAYSHHIERLMVMGNFMMLCEFDPDEIYRWFMEMYIDAYDWVMVPNVYSMSQYAGGGTTTTKPYISSSNYILKMSNYKKGNWAVIWDSLYWRFVNKHKTFINSNPRLSVMGLHLNKMDAEKLKNYNDTADNFLNNFGEHY